VDIVYAIDATGSMTYEINAAKKHVFTIFKELKDKFPENMFQFGLFFYRDKVYTKKYRNPDEYFPFTSDIKDLKKKISKVNVVGGGGDGVED
jgi:hypothetical protein